MKTARIAILSILTAASAAGVAAAPATAQTVNYGAIAIGETSGRHGYSYDYSTSYGAQQRALNECSANDCYVVVTFWNSCASVAEGPAGNIGWAHAPSRFEAEQLALGYAGGGQTIAWACTTR